MAGWWLVADGEMRAMQIGLNNGVAENQQLKNLILVCASTLGPIYKGAANFKEAVEEVTFRAKKFERTAGVVDKDLDAIMTAFQALANLTDDPTAMAIVNDAINKAGRSRAFIKSEREAKRQPTKPMKLVNGEKHP